MRYFASWLDVDPATKKSVFHTVPISDEISVVAPGERAKNAVYAAIGRFEVASAWLAEQQEGLLESVVSAAVAGACGGLDAHHFDLGSELWSNHFVLSDSPDGQHPGWWVSLGALATITRSLHSIGVEVTDVLKLSERSAVLRAIVRPKAAVTVLGPGGCVGGGTTCVVVKVYEEKPQAVLDILRWLHQPTVKAQWRSVGDVVEVLGELHTPKGYCVLFTEMQPLSVSSVDPAGWLKPLWDLLEALHRLGVVHGDVHAGNVAYTCCSGGASSGSGRVGLFDFDNCARKFTRDKPPTLDALATAFEPDHRQFVELVSRVGFHGLERDIGMQPCTVLSSVVV